MTPGRHAALWESGNCSRSVSVITHPAALLDPVAQPPVAEGHAAHVEHKERQDEQEGQGPTGGFDVDAVHRPGDRAPPTLLQLHQLTCSEGCGGRGPSEVENSPSNRGRPTDTEIQYKNGCKPTRGMVKLKCTIFANRFVLLDGSRLGALWGFL